MRSYIKIWGPPLAKAIKALEKIAIDSPEVCITDTFIEAMHPVSDKEVGNYFGPVGHVTEKRCHNIISKSGERLGEYDFFFEWFKDPSTEELNELIGKIDNELTPLGCKYTITTKAR